jgi:hypothetical protein
MNIAQRVREIEQIEERLREFSSDKERTKEEIQLALLDQADALHNIVLGLTVPTGAQRALNEG